MGEVVEGGEFCEVYDGANRRAGTAGGGLRVASYVDAGLDAPLGRLEAGGDVQYLLRDGGRNVAGLADSTGALVRSEEHTSELQSQ